MRTAIIFFAILLLIFLGLNKFVLAQDHEGWENTSSGTNWTMDIEQRVNHFDISKTFHSPKSLHIRKTGIQQGEHATFTKIFSVNEILNNGKIEPSELYFSIWMRNAFNIGFSGSFFTKVITINNSIYYREDLLDDDTFWHHEVIDLTSLLNETTITVQLKLYGTNLRSVLNIDSYWDNLTFSFDDETNQQLRKENLKELKFTNGGVEYFNDNGKKWRYGRYPGESTYLSDTELIFTIKNELNYTGCDAYGFDPYNERENSQYHEIEAYRWKEVLQDNLLDQLAEKGISVYIGLADPFKQAGHPCGWQYPWCAPYKKDYTLWAQEIAGLSLEKTNLFGFGIDDFANRIDENGCYYDNLDFLTPGYCQDMVNEARSINPRLSFFPTLYYDLTKRNGKTFLFGGNSRDLLIYEYRNVIDGIIFGYFLNTFDRTNNGWGSLFNTYNFDIHINEISVNLSALDLTNIPIITLFYTYQYPISSSNHVSSPEYLLELGQRSFQISDATFIHTLPTNYLAQISESEHIDMLLEKKQVTNLLYNYWKYNSRDEHIYVMNSGHGHFLTPGPEKIRYFFKPDFFFKGNENLNFYDYNYILSGDFDGDTRDEIAVFYNHDNPSISSNFEPERSQRIYIYETFSGTEDIPYKIQLTHGTGANGSWYEFRNEAVLISKHEYGLSGNFIEKNTSQIAVFYDAGDQHNSLQQVYLYKKSENQSSFEKVAGGNPSDTWYQVPQFIDNFDLHDYSLVMDVDNDGNDEIVVFYNGEGAGSTQKIYVYKFDDATGTLARVNGTQHSGSWYSKNIRNDNFDDYKYIIAGDFEGSGTSKILAFDSEKDIVYQFSKDPQSNTFSRSVLGIDKKFTISELQEVYCGNFNGNGKDNFAVFYTDVTEGLSRIQLYERADPYKGDKYASKFKPLQLKENGFGSDLFGHQTQYYNFDNHLFSTVAQLYDERYDTSPLDNKEEIVIFYKDNLR